MSYIATASFTYLAIGIAVNISYAFLFIYHLTKKETCKSIMIVAGCLCLAMMFFHISTLYLNTLATTSEAYKFVATNFYLIWLAENSTIILLISLLHKIFKIQCHHVVYYINRCMGISIFLNIAMYIDIIQLGNREPYWLWSLYSYGQNAFTLFMFASVVIARKWSEVFKWLLSAHSLKSPAQQPLTPPQTPSQSNAKPDSDQKLTELAFHYEVANIKRSGYMAHLKMLWDYGMFLYFTSAEQKQEFQRQRNITAEKMLSRYTKIMKLTQSDINKSMDDLEQWKSDLAIYEQRKPPNYKVKGKVLEVDFGRKA
jgi:hypothetical protein